MEESTPLLFDTPLSLRQSSLRNPRNSGGINRESPSAKGLINSARGGSRTTHHSSSGDYPRPRSGRHSQLGRNSQRLSYQKSNFRASSSTALNASSSSSSPHPTAPNNHLSKLLTQAFISLPYNLLCIASPYVPPCCGLCCCLTCIRTSEYGMLERFGKFDRVMEPGMHVLKWPVEREAGRVSIRMSQLDLSCETKTRDHFFLHVHVSIQYQVNPHHLFESFYSLTSPNQQLTSLTLDILRSTLPQKDVDDIFSFQESIALELHRYLNGKMNQYGYTIHHALLTKIFPNDHVMESMNEMQASKRMKEAMPHKAEAVRVKFVKEAEANAERAYLNGVGLARMRKEIVSGMKDVVESESLQNGDGESDPSISTKSLMDLLLLTQYFDLVTNLNGPVRKSNVAEGDRDQERGVGGIRVPSSLMLAHMPETVQQLQKTAMSFFASPSVVKEEKLLDTS